MFLMNAILSSWKYHRLISRFVHEAHGFTCALIGYVVTVSSRFNRDNIESHVK